MKSSKQKPATKKQSTPGGSTKQFVIWAIIILGIIALAIVTTRDKKTSAGEPATSGSQPDQIAATNTTAPASEAQPNFQKLTGRWLRPDGGYVIEIKSIDSTGKLDAGYFNPNPIHVAKAEAKREGNATKVFIELQDVNYPGSTYTLVYVPERDLLVGAYYQALQQQTFEVYFERLK